MKRRARGWSVGRLVVYYLHCLYGTEVTANLNREIYEIRLQNQQTFYIHKKKLYFRTLSLKYI